jgi:glycosyltransferase involved in cell wall biosynthesis
MKTNNKVLINAISIRTGGSETFLRNIIPLVTDLLPDFSFFLIIRSKKDGYYQNLGKNVRIIEINENIVGSPIKRLYFEHVTIPSYHLKYHTKIHWQMDEILSPFLLFFKIKMIATFHTTPMVFLKNLTNDGFISVLYMKMMRFITSHIADIVVCVSFHAKAELTGIYPSVINRATVIYHGVNDTLFKPGQPDTTIFAKFGIRKKYLLSISNRFVWKNYYRLVQAFLLFHRYQELSDYDLILIGESKNHDEELRINNYIKNNDIDNFVKILSFVDHSELHNFYKGAQTYVFPSLEETFGLTLLEAMACEIPVACSNWGVLPEIAGTAAVYFNPLDPKDICKTLREVCLNIQLRNKLVKIGKTQIKRFTWSNCATAYASLIKSFADFQNDNH